MTASQQEVITIMTNDFREGTRKLLIESYLHRHANECACAMCGRRGVPLAFHVIERSFDNEARDIPYEQGFVQFSPPVGYIRGAFPLCTTCAPPCRKCKLPTEPPSVHRFANSVQGKIGLGICKDHLHWFVVVEVIKHLWRTWVSPTQVLADQAVRMGWIAAGVESRANYKNTKFSRNGMTSLISHHDRNVELLIPPGPHRFKDFAKLEQWFATPKGRLSKDMAECMAAADAATDVAGDVPESPEAQYVEEVGGYIRMMADQGDIALHAQLYPDFMAASLEVYKAGFKCNVPARHVAGFIAEAAASYESSPSVGIELLEHTRDRIPQLWPGVKKAAL